MVNDVKKIKMNSNKIDTTYQCSSTTLDKLVAILVESEKEGNNAYYSLNIDTK